MTMGRRGFALLMVLGAVLVVCGGMALSLALLVDARRQVTLSNTEDFLRDSLAAAERMTTGWLGLHAQGLVLPPDKDSLSIVNERILCEEGDGDITVRLFDACSMIPARCLGQGGSLTRALPAQLAEIPFPDLPITLENEPRDWLETIPLPDKFRRFAANTERTHSTDWSTLGTTVRHPSPMDLPAQAGLAEVANPHSGQNTAQNTARPSQIYATFSLSLLAALANDVM